MMPDLSDERIAILGGPKTGKTWLSSRFTHPVRHTDELLARGGTEADRAGQVAIWFDMPGPWVIEGCTTTRALRMWLDLHAFGRPVDAVYWLDTPLAERTRRQESFARDIGTIWREVRLELLSRGVRVR